MSAPIASKVLAFIQTLSVSDTITINTNQLGFIPDRVTIKTVTYLDTGLVNLTSLTNYRISSNLTGDVVCILLPTFTTTLTPNYVISANDHPHTTFHLKNALPNSLTFTRLDVTSGELGLVIEFSRY